MRPMFGPPWETGDIILRQRRQSQYFNRSWTSEAEASCFENRLEADSMNQGIDPY